MATPCTNSRAQHEHEYICITCNCHTATVTTWDQINSIEQNSDLASVHCEQMGEGARHALTLVCHELRRSQQSRWLGASLCAPLRHLPRTRGDCLL